ncbi:EAL domain-containing protein [Halobacillus sp. BBL2006]|uniref:bifunctional diguanylate cyclase/phosphodiesterase n=1 Tax=Halobacillus sp. BBL2006 TaxID=1543706 RepID=UPI000543E77D|nr:EAL domain-containing protein [Halobacillus sp. BBL2006]KHE72793.1 histidine kinase [Halobacillus sp. BBL2006]
MAEEQSRYSRLAEITKLINTKLDLREVLQQVVTAISEEIMRCDSVGIYLPQEDGTFRGYVGKPEVINGMTLDMHVVDPRHDLLMKEVIDTRSSIYIPDTSKDDRPDSRAVEAFKINSLLVSPIFYEQELYGLVYLFDYGIPMNLTQLEIESVEAYVNMAAVAIRNANNLTRKQALIEEKQLLLNVTRDLSLCSSLQEALDRCFYYLGKVLKNPNIGAHFVDPFAERQIRPASLSKDSDWTEEAWIETHYQLKVDHTKDQLFKEVIETKKAIMIPDVYEDDRVNHDACRGFGVQAMYMIPFVAMGEVLGTITVVNLKEKGNAFSRSAMQLAESIVDATAPVISNLIYMEKQELIIQQRTSELRQKNMELKGAFTELQQISQEKELILNSAGEGIFGMDLDGHITFSNPSATNLLGYDYEKEVIGLSFYTIVKSELLSGEQPYDFAAYEKSKKNREQTDEFFTRKNGDLFPVEYVITPQRQENKTVGYVVTFKDVTSRKQMEEKIRYHAYYDSITNIPNRVLFQDRLVQALTYSEIHNRALAILFLDLDRFKKINDTFGHGFGDSVLKEVAHRLESVIPKEATVSRQGGDEFIILLPSVDGEEEATFCARQILDKFAVPFMIHDHEISIKTSIGISLYPDNGVTAETLVKHADVAMYKAKELTGNQYQVYTPDIENRSIEVIRLENDLYKALDQGNEFTLYYQPKIDVRNHKVIGAEALIRWNHPTLGLLSPTRFIPLAEETGLITKLGEWVLEQSCRQMKQWYDEGLTDLVISANLSPQQFKQDDLTHIIRSILEETELPPENLELELTENLIIHNTEKTLSMIQALKKLGVKISIDDFGTGFSSLGYLKDFPVDTLKIDKTFIDDITINANNAAITNTIITLASSLQLDVIAEGVETKKQVEFLEQNGCYLIQGFYFSRPIEPEQFLQRYGKISNKKG